ncbi:MAG TPA: hypothetical protein VFA76_17325 [Terriglobales bacterium]|nr:hypothetical protein [Terriglobales bacterium]
MPVKRTALLVRCTKEEAMAIRWAAKRERRTISAFILNAVEGRISSHRKILATFPGLEPRPGEKSDEATGNQERGREPSRRGGQRNAS